MGTTRMQLLTISFLVASTLAQGEDPCPPNPNSPSCDDPPQETICQLTCKRDSDCKQYEGDSNKCDKMGVDVSSEAHADMFSTRCKQICEESRDAEGCPASFNYTDSAVHFGCDHCNPYS